MPRKWEKRHDHFSSITLSLKYCYLINSGSRKITKTFVKNVALGAFDFDFIAATCLVTLCIGAGEVIKSNCLLINMAAKSSEECTA